VNVIHYRKPVAAEPKAGRPRIYDDEQRAQRHREAALQWHHANKHNRRKAA
jgi:hypothetical protein